MTRHYRFLITGTIRFTRRERAAHLAWRWLDDNSVDYRIESGRYIVIDSAAALLLQLGWNFDLPIEDLLEPYETS